ncbi:MAG: glycosyltransferase family 4 protein, partial [Phycicoccus sp.]
MSTVHVVVPAGVDDPQRPSGGNTYDRRLCDGLSAQGWAVCERSVPGDWPRPDPADRAAVAEVLREVPSGGTVVLDGLVASTVPEVLVPESGRLRLVVLVHLPLGLDVRSAEPDRAPPPHPVPRPRLATERASERPPESRAERSAEGAALGAATAVVVTSRWTGEWLRTTYRLSDDRVSVVPPGAETADLAAPSPAGGRLLCVGALTPLKGQDTLVDALATLDDLDWSCTLVGPTDADPGFTRQVVRRAEAAGIGARLRLTGARVGADLGAEYARADLLVVASRVETYGMVVTEALARGVPVVAPEVGGLPEALGHTRGGRRPGILVPAGDTTALAAALRRWLTDEA